MTLIAGVILAGGRATRMDGRDKAFLDLAGRPLVEHCVSRLAQQVGALAINSNAGAAAFEAYGLPVVPDLDDRRAGPLAGILAGMRWAATLETVPAAIVSVAVDTPFFPPDLVMKLTAASNQRSTIAMAACDGVAHPTFALWPVALAEPLERFIADGKTLKVTAFADLQGRTLVDFPQVAGIDPFFNLNKPADITLAGQMLDTSP